MRKVAHYYYGNDKELTVFVEQGRVFVRDKDNRWPVSPITKQSAPHPDEASGSTVVPEYVVLGLYYGLTMPDTTFDPKDSW